jgi:hypothetical protein
MFKTTNLLDTSFKAGRGRKNIVFTRNLQSNGRKISDERGLQY